MAPIIASLAAQQQRQSNTDGSPTAAVVAHAPGTAAAHAHAAGTDADNTQHHFHSFLMLMLRSLSFFITLATDISKSSCAGVFGGRCDALWCQSVCVVCMVAAQRHVQDCHH
jgi:hypothetical protein